MIATSQFTISVINDGAPGQQGVSVSNVIPEYRLSDSSTELTGDTTLPAYQWDTTKPEVPSGKYIWTRNRNELSNGTTVYSDAVCDVVTSGLVFDVDRNTNAITKKVWQTDITTSINSYDSTTTQGIRDRVTQTETDISGINTTISDVQSTLSTKADGSTVTNLTSRVQTVEDTAATHTRQISETNTALGNTITTANQTADQLSWVIDTNGKTASTFTFKNRVMELVNADLVIKDPSGNSTVISGGNIQSNSITTAMLATDAIKSTNYVAGESGSPYSSVGTFLDLSNGNIYMPNFGVGQVNGNDYAYFRGSIISSNGTIGGWTIGSTSLSISNVIEDYGGIEGNDVPTYVILADGTTGNNDVLVVRLGDEGNYTYPFYLLADGRIHATNAEITGVVNANTGSFGGSNGFVIDAGKIYSTYDNGKSTATSTNDGIYIGSQEGIYLGAYDSTKGSCPFQVTNEGVLTSVTGTIGGWTISQNDIRSNTVIENYNNISGNNMNTTVFVANGTDATNDFLVVRLGDQGSYAYPFYVRATGELYAQKATISGQINADTGSFGGANGFIIASNKIYSNGKSTATSTNNGIYIGSQEGIYFGAYDSTTGSCPFQVTNAGVLTSITGIIGGWTIDSTNGIYKSVDNSTAKLGQQQIAYYERSGSSFVKRTYTILGVSLDESFSSNSISHYYSTSLNSRNLLLNHYNKTQGVNGLNTITPDSITLLNNDGTYNTYTYLYCGSLSFSTFDSSDTLVGYCKIDPNAFVFGTSTGKRFIRGSVSSVPYLRVESTAAELTEIVVVNSKRNISLHVDAAGTAILRDNTNSSSIIYSNSSQQVVAPHEFIANSIKTSGSIAAGGTGTDQTGAVHAISSARNIALHANAAGNAGIYDSRNSNWIIASGSTQNVSIPHPLSITGTLNVSSNVGVSGTYILVGGTTATTSPYIQVANNKNNVALNCTQSLAGVYHYGSTGSTTAKWLIYIGTNGTVTANTSDIRYKNIYGNISEYETLTMLRGLDVINFSYKEDEKKIVQNGFKAQQMRDLLKSSGIGYRPYLDIQDVTCEESEPLYDLDAPEGNVLYGVDYSRFTPLLVSGWQIHDSRINELEAEIASLRSEIAALKRM